ncbi:MAG: hypothetical protein ACE5Q4_02760 [Nitrosopumilus sp.]|jgi:hypothetical protein
MGVKSWLVTLTPLAVAVATTVKAGIYGTDLTTEEINIIGFFVAAFIGSGIIGKITKQG